MNIKVLVLGATGSGKSSSICQIPEYEIAGLPPDSTFIIACKKKELPVRGWMRNYTHVPNPDVSPPSTGNYRQTNEAARIAGAIDYVSQNRPDIDTIVLDDTNYIMQDKYMNNKSSGFKIFTEIGNDMALVFKAIEKSEKDIVVFMHYEAVDENYQMTYKAKTVGKMVDNYLTIEGMFSNVLFAKQVADQAAMTIQKVFVTNYDGQFPAKTPVGAFPEVYIKNDMGNVFTTLREYFFDGAVPVDTQVTTNQASLQS